MRHKALIASSIIVAILLLILPFMVIPESGQTPLGDLLGHLHPLVVHFPIGIVVLALLLEGLNWWKKDMISHQTIRLILGLGLLSSVVSVLAGFFLYRSGEYTGELVRQHFWGAVLLSLCLIGTYWIKVLSKEKSGNIWNRSYMGLLIASNLLLIYTGHLGGTLTHGEDFLSGWMPNLRPAAPLELKPREELLVFDELLMPALEQNCQSCHNPNKTKGGLLLTSLADIEKGGKSGKAMFTAFDHEDSELYQRMILPLEDDEHMPPNNKPQPDSAVAWVLKAWIEQGASDSLLLSDLRIDDSLDIKPWLDRVIPDLAQLQRERMSKTALLLDSFEDLQALCDDLGLLMTLDEDMDSSHVAISMQIPLKPIREDVLPQLLPYTHLISKLSLPSAEISDDGLYTLKQFTELRSLFLQKTCIKGLGLVYLKDLPHLKLLNLSVSSVDETGLLYLLGNESLERVYLFDTETSPRTIDAMRHHMPNTEFLEEEGPYF